jgi:[NiFe] hydrogenase diaphorase moiety large subunit
MAGHVKEILKKYNGDAQRLMDILTDIQAAQGYVTPADTEALAEALRLSQVDVEQTLSFYHFFKTQPAGKYTVYLNESATAHMMGRAAIKKAFEEQAGCSFGSVSSDGLIGLFATACIGMSDQEPAALINATVFTSLTPAKVKTLVAAMRAGQSVDQMVTAYGDGANSGNLIQSMVRNNIYKKGPVILADFEPGAAVKKCVSMTPEVVIAEIKKSNLRGRGGAGFPAGLKWEFCSKAQDPQRFIVCNADEGEPGTFKDRVILTERPDLLVEGMIVAGYAIGAQQGLIYLRSEYRYLERHLENVLAQYRAKKFLGQDVAGKKGFNFDIRIQFGAGAYVCGEESALLESAEGKRGEPRIRPPFPVEKGYLNKPTAVNNVETLCSAARILLQGADWYKAMGTEHSAGTKLLSVSGDCEKPGVYEIEWGLSIKDLLAMVAAQDVKAVVVGGPSGNIIGPKQFDRKLCFSDLATGGSIIVIGQKRDLLEIVHNFIEFFCDESCGACIPCRIGNVLIRTKLEKILKGHGVKPDLAELVELGNFMKTANRCGLGQTSANPVLTTIQNLPEEYDKRLRQYIDSFTGFDLAAAVKDSCAFVGRDPREY